MTPEELLALRGRLEAALSPEAILEVEENGAMRIDPNALLDVGHYLRDEEGFDYLSNLSGVDWIEAGEMEVVYHLYAMRRGARIAGGETPDGPLGPVVLKVRTGRAQPLVPSLTPIWDGALWQERETYDMLGIRFEGHPDLRRIYLWDKFEDHPLRKDYVPEEA